MQENAFETNPVSATTPSIWSSSNTYLNQSLSLFLKSLLFFCMLIYFSCDNIDGLDVAPSDATEIDSTLTFFTVSTTSVTRKPILHTVELTGEIDEGDCLCLEEVGFFYSFEAETLFNQDLSYQDLINDTSNITRIEIPQQNIIRVSSNPKGEFSYTFDLPIVDTTYFFRSYAIFHDSKTQRLERTHLSQEINPIQVTLKNGWYKETFEGDLWARRGAFAVDNPDIEGGIILGLGCQFPSFCATDIKDHPFLKLDFKNNDKINIEEQFECPYDDRNNIYNRQNPVAFTLDDLIYFGTGEIDGAGSKDFFTYNPKRCFEDYEDTNHLELPDTFSARTGAIGFAINQFGYIGLGRTYSLNPKVDIPLGDFWRFDPSTQEWCSLEITTLGDVPYKYRYNAITVVTNDEYIIFGGGVGKLSSSFKDFWKFTPDPNNCTAIIEPVSAPPIIGRGGDGISFTINNIPYAGLGNLNTSLYKLQEGTWSEVAPLPDLPISAGIGFSSGNRGYLFGGSKNDGTLTNLSNDLWIYVPE